MPGSAPILPLIQFTNALGLAVASGTVDTYIAGSLTPTPTWQDEDLTILNTNPIQLNSSGQASIFLAPAVKYKFLLKNALGATVPGWPVDDISSIGSLAAAAGSASIGFVQAGTGAVTRTAQDKLREAVSVLDFGAVGDGVTDDTAAIALALAEAAEIGVRGGTLLFPPGRYKCHIDITGAVNNTLGEFGLLLSGYGATLIGRAADASIIRINGAVVGTDPAPGSNAYANGLCIEGFTLDMSAMANAATTYGFAIQRAYNSTAKDLHVIGEPNSGGGFYLGNNTYTWSVENLNCARVKIHGYNNSSNMSSTIAFYTLVANQVVIDNAFSIGFFGPVIQGSMDHFVLSDAQSINVIGGDLEGVGGVVYAFGANVRAVTSIGNTVGGYTFDTYSSGNAAASNLADRPPLSGESIGTYGRANGSGRIVIANTSPNNIYKFTDSASGQGGGLFFVCGDEGLNGFADVVLVAFGAVAVVSSNTQYGAPPARTYSYSANALRVALASVAANNVKCVALECLSAT